MSALHSAVSGFWVSGTKAEDISGNSLDGA